MQILLFISLLTAFSPLRAISQDQLSPTDFLEQSILQNPSLRGAVAGAKAIRLESGETLASYQENLNLIPASCMKLMTTGLGLRMLGPEFRFITRLSYTGILVEGTLKGDLILSGGGDPSLGSEEFPGTNASLVINAFLEAIRSAGIRTIEGKISTSSDIYPDQPIAPSWQWEDFGNGYGASPRGINWKDNSFELVFLPGKRPGKAAVIQNIPDFVKEEKIENRVITGKAGSKTTINIYSVPNHPGYLAEGTIAPEVRSVKVEAATTRPESLFIHDLKEALKLSGIEVLNKSFAKDLRSTELLSIQSPSYIVIAQKTNEKSINFFAESIFKQIGLRSSFGGSYSGGKEAMDSILESIGLNPELIRLVDGSGLSRKDHISAGFFCSFLQKMYETSDFNTFIQCIPRGGEGNLTRFLKGSP
ncbi:MAG: D-alanyl-D-alanine carboxypeptidase/D-alanyl-D-alanine-endopeptidase, partial [Bacteroidales bacterium]|nr:D-alanyl-D-alanine carboxypeptidase/D-alanyl-D-alanine-endopeptidase [Bacteroidales bacterium]